MYPDNPDYVGSDPSDTNSAHVKKTIQIKYQGTIDESRGENQSLNRLEFRDMYDCVPRVSYSSQNHHLLPSTLTEFQIRKLNQLPAPHDCSCCPDKQKRFC